MRKSKKILGLSVLGLPVLAFISCGDNVNEFANSKEIRVAKYGPQTEFWNQVENEFKNTESYKNGYRLVFIEKEVFGAIDQIVNTSLLDKNSPDLIYSPQDRITDLLSKRALKPYSEEFKNKLIQQINASDAEKSFINSFGSFRYVNDKNASFYNFAHNKEGIVMMSSQTLEEVKKDLENKDTDEMVELVKEGKAFFRIQDGWYGNGILGGHLTSDEMKKMFYVKEDGTWSSGFLKSDSNHSKFKEAVKVAAELMFPVWEAAFSKTEEEYKQTKWSQNGIEQNDLKTLLQHDMGPVQNKVQELLAAKKLKYAFVGSWDVGNASNQGINTFLNTPKLKNDKEYIQAAGSWSWAINSRNNGASVEREKALEEVLSIIFKTESYYAYFKKDTKIPYYTNIQDRLKTRLDEDRKLQQTSLSTFATEAGYANIDELLAKFNENVNIVQQNLSKVYGQDKSWSQEQNSSPLNDANLYTEVYDNTKSKYPGVTDEHLTKLTSNPLKQATGLRNAIAALLGLTDLANLKGSTNETWQIAKTLLKTSSVPKDLEQDENNLHIRKVEKLIFGANGDNGGEKVELTQELKNAESRTKKLAEVKKAAAEFSKTYAKTAVNEETINKAAELYFNNYINQADWLNWKDGYEPQFLATKFPKKDSSSSDKTVSEVTLLVNEYKNGNVAQKIIDVITSTKPLSEKDGLGVFNIKEGRLDNWNPQFKQFWGIWNDQSFGSAKFYESIAKGTTLEQFQEIFVNKIDELVQVNVNTWNSSNAPDFIK
ncbi:hypothetical protein [Mesomycoplasma lagogenitalium]|uniref:Lipoprotein n=1 Tax=Mesomycoplasma lagogenitalium TaxID=171286 RepID=A0ABY8LU25_9BACT|nr:hypothetical protein [Mesomycoplasma lagogenitalium]WGI36744.1 hypothetical protein QEG99_00440 [Mesomycoplasma lagogenitalium]